MARYNTRGPGGRWAKPFVGPMPRPFVGPMPNPNFVGPMPGPGYNIRSAQAAANFVGPMPNRFPGDATGHVKAYNRTPRGAARNAYKWMGKNKGKTAAIGIGAAVAGKMLFGGRNNNVSGGGPYYQY